MIFQIKVGRVWNCCFPDGVELVADRPMITDDSSTQFAGFIELERRGGTCRRALETGKILIGVFADGVMLASGKCSVRKPQKSMTWNGL
jgi:hypothetical protein